MAKLNLHCSALSDVAQPNHFPRSVHKTNKLSSQLSSCCTHPVYRSNIKNLIVPYVLQDPMLCSATQYCAHNLHEDVPSRNKMDPIWALEVQSYTLYEVSELRRRQCGASSAKYVGDKFVDPKTFRTLQKEVCKTLVFY